MSRLWRVDGEAVELRAVSDAQRTDGFKVSVGGRTLEVSARRAPDGTLIIVMPDGTHVLASVSLDPQHAGVRWVSVGEQTFVLKEAESSSDGADDHAGLEAPMPGKVLSVDVSPGDEVRAGSVLMVVEAMKMEHAIKAPADGKVLGVSAAPGDMVSPGSPLVDFEAAG